MPGSSHHRNRGGTSKAGWLIAAATLAFLWSGAAMAAEARVLLLRGWFGVFSTGMDSLAQQLRARGVNAQAVGHLTFRAQADRIIRDRAAGKVGRIVLVGHSQGANNVIEMARMLERYNIQVDLLVTLAPFMQDPIPANVVRALNYYQEPGWGAPLSGDAGFHGRLSNIDLAGDASVSHITIDKSDRVQNDLLREIYAVARAR
ncbi:lipase [Enterovirga sp.]|uniref:lipase n=1 Tax=Enterovirga sp. TaxID=2026350 RepID=UPI002BDAF078|nr:lipase [Enterovirga sp.]HMO30465.1 lipase [Enterovirga sp.]